MTHRGLRFFCSCQLLRSDLFSSDDKNVISNQVLSGFDASRTEDFFRQQQQEESKNRGISGFDKSGTRSGFVKSGTPIIFCHVKFAYQIMFLSHNKNGIKNQGIGGFVTSRTQIFFSIKICESKHRMSFSSTFFLRTKTRIVWETESYGKVIDFK